VRISVIFSLGRRYGLRAACAAAESDGSPNIPASGMAELFKRDLRLMGFKGTSTGSVLQFQAQRPRKNNFSATGVAQTLSLPRPDSSGRAFEHARQASR
jgi:hypothetical protein